MPGRCKKLCLIPNSKANTNIPTPDQENPDKGSSDERKTDQGPPDKEAKEKESSDQAKPGEELPDKEAPTGLDVPA